MNNDHTYHQLLISRFLSNEASESEKQKVIDLLEYDTSFKEMYLSMQKTVNAVDAELLYSNIDEKKALKSIFKKAGIVENKNKTIPLALIIKIAAVFVIGILITTLIVNKPKPIQISSNDSIIEKTFMPDSSTISLNKNSTLLYSNKYGKKTRSISISGEAFFDVKRNTNIPFIVDCDDLYVEVIGTSFNINNSADSNLVYVFVKSGKVRVYNNTGKQEFLNKGEMVIYNRKENTLIKSMFDINTNVNAWLTKTLTFEDCPLQQVVSELNDYYKVSITLDVENLENCRLSATFQDADLNSVLEMICLSFGLDKSNNELIILQGSGC